MRRKLLLFLAVLAIGTTAAVGPARASAVLPYQSHPHGHAYPTWLRMVGQWFLGDSSNPLLAGLQHGDCGTVMHGVFFMVAPIEVGARFDCHVRAGRPIVLSHAGFFATAGIDGDTDEDAVVIIVSNRVSDPRTDAETVPDFWPDE